MVVDVFLNMNGYRLDVERNEGLEYTVAIDTEDIEIDYIAFWINGKISERE